MHQVFGSMRGLVKKSTERDRASEHYIESASKCLWPWSEPKLLIMVSLVAVLDYTSTYAALKLSGNGNIYEASPLASWALHAGGFGGLLLADLAVISILLLLAAVIRFLFSRFGFKGFGRAAFVILLVPYLVATMVAVFNNVALTFL